MVLREDQGLPARSLVPLAVGGHAEDAARLAPEPLAQREARREGGTVSQAAGRERDPIDPPAGGMAAEDRAIAVELLQVGVTQPREGPERHVERPGGVPLREDELILGL